jgi:hypothetical protein
MVLPAAVLLVIGLPLTTAVDFVGDVAGYAGHEPHRVRVQEHVLDVIARGQQVARDARLVLAGHSLGSVVAIDVAERLRSQDPKSPPAVLVTAGSPLTLMCRVFPQALSQATQRAGCTNLGDDWLNLWRSGDSVGRRLGIAPAAGRRELCIGRGGHADYWVDKRTSRSVRDFLTTTPSSSQADATETQPTERGLLERTSWGVVSLSAGVLFLLVVWAGWWLVSASPRLHAWATAVQKPSGQFP